MAAIVPCTWYNRRQFDAIPLFLKVAPLSPASPRLRRVMRQRWPDLIACALLVSAAVIVLRGPILRGEVFLPLDLLPHMPPWSYSYERTAVANAAPSDLILEYY